MEFVDKIAVGEPPAKPDTMVKVTVASDAEKAEAPAAEETAPAEAKKPAAKAKAKKAASGK